MAGPYCHRLLRGLFFVRLHFDDLDAAVVAAIAANLMRALRGTAFRAGAGGRFLEPVMRTTPTLTRVGLSTFWDGHGLFLSIQGTNLQVPNQEWRPPTSAARNLQEIKENRPALPYVK